MPTLPRSSTPRRSRPGAVLLLLGAALTAACLLSVLAGSTRMDWGEALRALAQGDFRNADYRILMHVRLPRTVAALLSGAALSTAGVLIQAVLNNALAAPNTIGVNAGAGFFALLVIALFPGAIGALPVYAFLGALLASLLIYAIAAQTGASRTNIILAGVAVSSVLTAGINAVKTLFPDSLYNANAFLIGGFSGVSFSNLTPAWLLIAAGLGAALLLRRALDVLALGEETAQGLGLHVKAVRFGLLVVASVLAGGAVSFSGLLGFVGLIVPHVARRLVGNGHKLLLPASMLGGGAFVLLCDTLSRVLFAPYELPVGILMSLIGGPFFIFLILRQRRSHLHD